jgi:hypothetical protein
MSFALAHQSKTNKAGDSKTSTPATSPPPQPQRLAVAEDEGAQTRKTLVREIKRIDAWTNNLIDNGLFDKRHKKLFVKKQKEDELRAIMDGLSKDIQDNMYTARKSLDNDDLPASDYYVAQALRAYEKPYKLHPGHGGFQMLMRALCGFTLLDFSYLF